MALHKLILLFLSFSIFAACSTTHKAYLESIMLTFESEPDPIVPLSSIQNSPVDLLYVRVGDRPRAVLALAYIENSHNKWVSGDNAMLIEKGGRIVKTIGTSDNLYFVSNLKNDPLNDISRIEAISYWKRSTDYGKDKLNALVESHFELINDADLIIDKKTAKTQMVKERVTFHLSLERSSSWNNFYWFDIETNQLLKSIQQLTPNSEQYSLTYVSRIGRLPLSPILNMGE